MPPEYCGDEQQGERGRLRDGRAPKFIGNGCIDLNTRSDLRMDKRNDTDFINIEPNVLNLISD